PDYKFPSSIVTEHGFLDYGFDVSAFAWQTVKKDAQYPQTSVFSAERVWPVVIRNGLGMDLANSFLVVASDDVKSSRLEERDQPLAYHYATSRERRFCKATEFVRNSKNELEVYYRSLAPSDASIVQGDLMRMYVPRSANYVRGRLLSQDVLKVVTATGWRLEQLREILIRYVDFVLDKARVGKD